MANSDFDFTIKDMFYQFVGLNRYQDKIKPVLMCTPKLNYFLGEQITSFSDTIHIHQGEVIYVGSTTNIHQRYIQHIDSQLDGTGGMKFGRRPDLFSKLKFIFQEVDSDSEIKYSEYETYIRKFYGSRFGS